MDENKCYSWGEPKVDQNICYLSREPNVGQNNCYASGETIAGQNIASHILPAARNSAPQNLDFTFYSTSFCPNAHNIVMNSDPDSACGVINSERPPDLSSALDRALTNLVIH